MRSAAACSSPNLTGQILPGCAARVHRRQKTESERKRRMLWTVRSEKSLIYQAPQAPKRGRWYKVSPAPENAGYTVHKMPNGQYHLYPSAGKRRSASPGSRISSLKPPHSSPCPARQRFCTPLSCAGQSYPAEWVGG